jgi:hypothetical protein
VEIPKLQAIVRSLNGYVGVPASEPQFTHKSNGVAEILVQVPPALERFMKPLAPDAPLSEDDLLPEPTGDPVLE